MSTESPLRSGYVGMSGNLNKSLLHLTDTGLLAYTIPGKPNSRNQKRGLTDRGKRVAESLGGQ